MINMIRNVIGSTRWSFVIIMTVVSLLLGTLWYSKVLFGPMYMKYVLNGKMKGSDSMSMMRPIVYETISRILFFIGFWWILVTRGKVDFMGALPVGILVWLVYVFATQLSLIARLPVNKRVIWVVTLQTLVQTIIATRLFTYLIS